MIGTDSFVAGRFLRPVGSLEQSSPSARQSAVYAASSLLLGPLFAACVLTLLVVGVCLLLARAGWLVLPGWAW